MAADYTDDEVLVAGLRAGHDNAFAWLLDRYDGPSAALARTFVASTSSADEVVQETWLAVIEGIGRFEQRSSLKTWIHRILMNKARTRGVRDHRSIPFAAIVGDGDGLGPTFPADRFLPADHQRWPGHWAVDPPAWEARPPEQLEAQETAARIRAAIDDLPAVHKVVITCRDVEGWSSADVCDLLDLTPANQRVLLHRARARVRNMLEDYFSVVAP